MAWYELTMFIWHTFVTRYDVIWFDLTWLYNKKQFSWDIHTSYHTLKHIDVTNFIYVLCFDFIGVFIHFHRCGVWFNPMPSASRQVWQRGGGHDSHRDDVARVEWITIDHGGDDSRGLVTPVLLKTSPQKNHRDFNINDVYPLTLASSDDCNHGNILEGWMVQCIFSGHENIATNSDSFFVGSFSACQRWEEMENGIWFVLMSY